MYKHMNYDHLVFLVDCLIESHMFARTFNSNNEQRNLLWKAGKRKEKEPKFDDNSVLFFFKVIEAN